VEHRVTHHNLANCLTPQRDQAEAKVLAHNQQGNSTISAADFLSLLCSKKFNARLSKVLSFNFCAALTSDESPSISSGNDIRA